MPKYLIHVGPHKTATTYLQLRFDAARGRLRQAGVAYPTMWNASQTDPSHRGLMVGLRDGQLAQLTVQFAAIERDRPDYVLISGEGLNLLEPSAIDLLKALVGDNSVTIIFYCRRWSELLPSLWQEKVKHGADTTLPEFLHDEAGDPFASPAMNFARRLDIYAKIFGRQSIKLLSYSNISDERVDLAKHFFDCFLPQQRQLLDDPYLAEDRPNQSFPTREVEVVRALNAIHKRNGFPNDATLRNWFIAAKSGFDLSGLYSAIDDNAATLRLSDTSADLQRLHAMLFATYSDLMLPPVLPQRLFAPRESDIVYHEPHYLADDAPLRALENLYASFRKRKVSGA